MDESTLKSVSLAAADLESAEFQRDSAELELLDAIGEAVAVGADVETIAEAANLTRTEVVKAALTPAAETGDTESEPELLA